MIKTNKNKRAYLNFFDSERKKKSIAMLAPEPVDTPGVNGPGQVIIHLLLRVSLLLLSARTNTKPEQKAWKG